MCSLLSSLLLENTPAGACNDDFLCILLPLALVADLHMLFDVNSCWGLFCPGPIGPAGPIGTAGPLGTSSAFDAASPMEARMHMPAWGVPT